MVATDEKQGKRKNDFCWAKKGELVKFGFECDGESVDGGCGCRRSFAGFETHKASTTAEVQDREITREEYRDLFCGALRQEGWLTDDGGLSPEDIDEELDELIKTAEVFQTGSIIEKRGNSIKVRV